MTKEQLAAENERLGKEVAALRVLLAAVRDLATVPYPADQADMQWHYITCGSRIDSISIYANPDMTVGEGPRSVTMLHNAAEDLRQLAARPLRYTPKAAEPEPADEAWQLTAKGIETADAQAAGQ